VYWWRFGGAVIGGIVAIGANLQFGLSGVQLIHLIVYEVPMVLVSLVLGLF